MAIRYRRVNFNIIIDKKESAFTYVAQKLHEKIKKF
jgi:hypothetical protein